MCQFCENITNKDKEFIWEQRSTYADDNLCEFVNDDNCSGCGGWNSKFKLRGYKADDRVYVGVEYEQEITSRQQEKVVIRPFSETLQLNFCPSCGKQISKYTIKFEDMHNIEIHDEEE